jgi:hypothetical protein
MRWSKSADMEKKKSKVEVVLIVITSLVAVIIAAAIAFTLYIMYVDYNTPIRDKITDIGRIYVLLDGRTNADENNLSYFDTIDSAITSYFNREVGNLANVPDFSQEIVRFESQDYLLVVFPTRTTIVWQRTSVLWFGLLKVNPPYVSYPIYGWAHGIYELSYSRDGIWYDEDRIARDLIISRAGKNVTSMVNDGVPIYYGVGVGLPPQQISILGSEPDRIVHFEYGGRDYFFWYYLSNPYIDKQMSEKVDLESGIVLGEIIELFDIKVVR